MKNLSTFVRQCVLAIALIFVPSAVLVPALVSAAAPVKATAAISSASLSATTASYPYVTGSASSVSRIRLSITTTTSTRTLYKSPSISVSKGSWHASVLKKLPTGEYTVRVYSVSRGALLTRGTLIVSGDTAALIPAVTSVTTTTVTPTPTATTPSISVGTINSATSSTVTTTITNPNIVVVAGPTSLRVSSIPLLSGGTTPPGSTVPVMYLQVVNQGDASTTINGFWLQQDGTASVDSIIGFTTVDDKGNNRKSTGGTEGQSAFVNGKGYAVSGSSIGPHQMKLFTIKAQISAHAVRGTNLQLNVAGVDAPQAIFNSTFPIMGVTWAISG